VRFLGFLGLGCAAYCAILTGALHAGRAVPTWLLAPAAVVAVTVAAGCRTWRRSLRLIDLDGNELRRILSGAGRPAWARLSRW
jgi:hypothetical protein